MDFEFDPSKSLLNKEKHGIDFEEAQLLWNSDIAEVESNRQSEKRVLVIGMIGIRHWTAIITNRDPDIIRIISVRRSRPKEVEIYAS